MFINLIPINFQYRKVQSNAKHKCVNYPNLTPLTCDTISFGAMKKSEFEGIDLAVVQKFKAPIEKFNSNDDLQKWAGEQAKVIADNDFGGRHEETEIQRKAMLGEWFGYVLDENNAYKKTTALLILNAITKYLEPDNDNIPPVLNKGVLADCIFEIDKNTKNDPKYQFDFKKMYQNKLRAFYMDDIETDTSETATKWVIIPSAKHDPKNFKANVEKLKVFSHKTWCTKSSNAEPYLWQGDFHVYLENGKPKLGVRFVEEEIKEIQGEQNNNKIPLNYLDIIQKYISENKLKLTTDAKKEIKAAKLIKTEIKKIKKDLKEAIKKNDVKKIYNYFGTKVEEDKDGYLTISKYVQPSKDYTFKDLGIDENKLLEKVKRIEGDADFSNSQATDLRNLEYIGWCANFRNSQVVDLKNLKHIGIDADFRNSQITNLENLKTIGRDAYFSNSQVVDLRSLEYIRGDADFSHSQVTNLKNLNSIGKSADFSNSQAIDLRNLKSIGEFANFSHSRVTDLRSLKSIGEGAIFSYSKVIDLRNLRSIGMSADFSHSQVANISKLKLVKDNVFIKNSPLTIEDFKNVKVGGKILN